MSLDFSVVKVKFVGNRKNRFKTHVYIDGDNYSNGYITFAGAEISVFKCEADVLTGVTPPKVAPEGTVLTGFVVAANLGPDGLVDEKYVLVVDDVDSAPEPVKISRVKNSQQAVQPATEEGGMQ